MLKIKQMKIVLFNEFSAGTGDQLYDHICRDSRERRRCGCKQTFPPGKSAVGPDITAEARRPRILRKSNGNHSSETFSPVERTDLHYWLLESNCFALSGQSRTQAVCARDDEIRVLEVAIYFG